MIDLRKPIPSTIFIPRQLNVLNDQDIHSNESSNEVSLCSVKKRLKLV